MEENSKEVRILRESDDNPTRNRLDAGVDARALEDAVRLSGYPLQRIVAEKLLDSFDVREEWAYVDRESDKHRSLDLVARRQMREGESLSIDLALLIECKRAELPYVFFRAAAPAIPRDFPAVTGIRGHGQRFQIHQASSPGGSRDGSVAELLRLRELGFVREHGFIANSFARAERKSSKRFKLSGSVPYQQIVLPLASALEHFAAQQDRIGSPKSPACVSLAVCVLDAPMVFVEGNAEAPHLCLRPWIRVIREEASRDPHGRFARQQVVDFVHREFVDAFIAEHALPFANEYAERALGFESLLVAGKASVPSLEGWSLDDVKPV